MIGFRLFRSQMPSLLLYALFPRVKQKELTSFTISLKSKNYHALDSFVFEYVNCGGVKDNLKIEINYMLRCHVLSEVRREVKLP